MWLSHRTTCIIYEQYGSANDNADGTADAFWSMVETLRSNFPKVEQLALLGVDTVPGWPAMGAYSGFESAARRGRNRDLEPKASYDQMDLTAETTNCLTIRAPSGLTKPTDFTVMVEERRWVKRVEELTGELPDPRPTTPPTATQKWVLTCHFEPGNSNTDPNTGRHPTKITPLPTAGAPYEIVDINGSLPNQGKAIRLLPRAEKYVYKEVEVKPVHVELLQSKLAANGVAVEGDPVATNTARICRWQDAFNSNDGADVPDFIALDRDRLFVKIAGDVLPSPGGNAEHMVEIDTGIDKTSLSLSLVDGQWVSEPFIVVGDAVDDETYNGKAGNGLNRDNLRHDQTVAGAPGWGVKVTVKLAGGASLSAASLATVAEQTHEIQCQLFVLTSDGTLDPTTATTVDDIFLSAQETWAQLGVNLRKVGAYEVFPIKTPPEFWNAIEGGELDYRTPRTVDGQLEWFSGYIHKMAPVSGGVIRVFFVPALKIANVPLKGNGGDYRRIGVCGSSRSFLKSSSGLFWAVRYG